MHKNIGHEPLRNVYLIRVNERGVISVISVIFVNCELDVANYT